MKKNEKNLLIGAGVIAAIVLLVYAWRKKSSFTERVKVLIGTTENGTPVVTQMPAVQAQNINVQPVATSSSGETIYAAPSLPQGAGSMDTQQTIIVGAYNPVKDGTWIFPADGNTGDGIFVAGEVLQPEGVAFKAAGTLSQCCIGNECTGCGYHVQCGPQATRKACAES